MTLESTGFRERLGAALLVLSGTLWVLWQFPARANAADPQPSETIQAEGGLLHDYRDPGQSAFYYRLTYQGQVVRSQGKPLAAVPGLNGSLAQDRDTTGDTGQFALRLERGALDAHSSLFDVLGVKPLALSIPSLQSLRGVAQASGSLENGTLNLSAGLETPPAHPFRVLNNLANTGITNWVIAGFQGQRRQRDTLGSQVTKESGVFTARAFVGRGFGWTHSQQLTGLRKELLRDALAEATTFEQALALRAAIKRRIRDTTATAADMLIYYIAEEGESLSPAEQRDPSVWIHKLTQAATFDAASTPPDQPRVAVWLEGLLWREVGRDRETDAWLSGTTATLRWWPVATHPDAGWLSVVYVNGFDRAAPGPRREQLLLTYGTSF